MGRKPMKTPTEKLITPLAVREEMFQYWMTDDVISNVARKFKLARTTVERICKREGWNARRVRIMAEIEETANTDMAKEILSNIDTVKIIRRGVAAKLMNRLDKKTFKPSLRDFVLIMELEEKMSGNIPTDPKEHVINIFNKMPEPEQDRLALDTAKVCDAIRARDRGRIA